MYTVRNDDFSDILKLVLESDPPAPVDPAAPAPVPAAATPEAMSPKNVTVLIRELRAALGKQLNAFTVGLAALDKRMTAVMTSLTSSAGADAGSVQTLTRRVADLQRDFDTKSGEVDNILAKVEELIPNMEALPEAKTRLAKIQDGLGKMKQELDAKARECEELAHQVTSGRAAAHADMETLQQSINDLDNYATDVEQQLEKAKRDIERLETHLNQGQRMKVPTSSLDTAGTKHYGEFNLTEHLERARKKQGFTETWF